MPTTKEILKKYGSKIEYQMRNISTTNTNFSNKYKQFKQDMLPELSRYERWTKTLGNIIKMRVSPKESAK